MAERRLPPTQAQAQAQTPPPLSEDAGPRSHSLTHSLTLAASVARPPQAGFGFLRVRLARAEGGGDDGGVGADLCGNDGLSGQGR